MKDGGFGEEEGEVDRAADGEEDSLDSPESSRHSFLSFASLTAAEPEADGGMCGFLPPLGVLHSVQALVVPLPPRHPLPTRPDTAVPSRPNAMCILPFLV